MDYMGDDHHYYHLDDVPDVDLSVNKVAAAAAPVAVAVITRIYSAELLLVVADEVYHLMIVPAAVLIAAAVEDNVAVVGVVYPDVHFLNDP